MKKIDKSEFPVSLLTFTYFFAVTIYVFLLGYHYWSPNRDIEASDDSDD